MRKVWITASKVINGNFGSIYLHFLYKLFYLLIIFYFITLENFKNDSMRCRVWGKFLKNKSDCFFIEHIIDREIDRELVLLFLCKECKSFFNHCVGDMMIEFWFFSDIKKNIWSDDISLFCNDTYKWFIFFYFFRVEIIDRLKIRYDEVICNGIF